jgi:drug/metabolite transporter (DMT)-like permease
VSLQPNFASAAYSLAAVLAWGTSDFMGGYATRRANAFLFTAIFSLGGLILVGTLAEATHAHLPTGSSALWALAGGISGGTCVAVFFRALSSGRMGLTAPVAAVLGAAIPTLFSIFTEGWPGPGRTTGFCFAVAGLWLITRAEDGSAPAGIGLAVIAGIGFAGFFLCVRQAGDVPPLWGASFVRVGGLLTTGGIALAQHKFREISRKGIVLAVIAGCIDTTGTVLFIRASQSGRLDEAVVLSSLYPAITVLLARLILKEHFTRWKFVGVLAALASVPMIATG